MRQVCVTMLASLPPLGRALAAAAVPVLVAGRTLAAAEPLHRLAANLTGARGPGAQRALTPMLAPILVAGRTPPLRQPRSRASTMAAGPEERGPQWRTRRALASVATPVHLTHATAPLGKGVPRREAAPTDATGARRHASTPSRELSTPGPDLARASYTPTGRIGGNRPTRKARSGGSRWLGLGAGASDRWKESGPCREQEPWKASSPGYAMSPALLSGGSGPGKRSRRPAHSKPGPPAAPR
jgi:hypothetical protein